MCRSSAASRNASRIRIPLYNKTQRYDSHGYHCFLIYPVVFDNASYTSGDKSSCSLFFAQTLNQSRLLQLARKQWTCNFIIFNKSWKCHVEGEHFTIVHLKVWGSFFSNCAHLTPSVCSLWKDKHHGKKRKKMCSCLLFDTELRKERADEVRCCIKRLSLWVIGV